MKSSRFRRLLILMCARHCPRKNWKMPRRSLTKQQLLLMKLLLTPNFWILMLLLVTPKTMRNLYWARISQNLKSRSIFIQKDYLTMQRATCQVSTRWTVLSSIAKRSSRPDKDYLKIAKPTKVLIKAQTHRGTILPNAEKLYQKPNAKESKPQPIARKTRIQIIGRPW